MAEHCPNQVPSVFEIRKGFERIRRDRRNPQAAVGILASWVSRTRVTTRLKKFSEESPRIHQSSGGSARPAGSNRAAADSSRLGQTKGESDTLWAVTLRACTVGFKDVRGIRHSADVEAESLYEAVVLAVRRFRQDPWMQQVGNATVLDVEVREPPTKHSISLQQVERWLAGTTSNPTEAMKKAKLKMILVQS
jgi:hypothetical protein